MIVFIDPMLVKKNKIWLWTTVNHWKQGILAWVLGDRSAQTFKPLWKIIRGWQSFWYVTDARALARQSSKTTICANALRLFILVLSIVVTI